MSGAREMGYGERYMNWLRKLYAIVRNYDADRARLNSLDKLIRERTDVHADLGFHDNFVITVGRYKNREYIRVHALPDTSFQDVVDRLRYEQKHGQLRVVDAPPAFKACIDPNLFQ